MRSTAPSASARHSSRTGQSRQLGDSGRHTVAPSSINAWFQSPGRSSATSVSATRHSAFSRTGSPAAPSRAKSRASTRATFPSTTGTGSPKAIEATAPTVYRPNPGSAASVSTVRGNRPPWSRTMACAAR